MDLNAFSWFDTGGDGAGDLGVADTNGDGYVDSAAFDGNADGYVEGYAFDTNGDGFLESSTFDTDLDGFLDSQAFDVNGDSQVDYVSSPSTGGQLVAAGPVADTSTAVIGPGNGSSPQAVIGGLMGGSNDPLTQITLARILNNMNASTGIWTSPSYSW